MGKSDKGNLGPGAKYQIDATVGDIYLVSSINREWIIGRPVIYVIIDVFSRMVAGIYVGLEGPSWIGAMMALANAASDKVEFCRDYGINITEEDWPCSGIPESILADRGEMEGKNIDTLINTLHVKIENTPPYRADWKGIVEQYFRTLNIKVKPLAPGYIDTDFRERGGQDYRLDAKMDISEFTEMVIRCVLYHNNHNWMDSYSRDEELAAGNVDPIPIQIWNWGIIHRSGSLRSTPDEIVKLSLMPAASATVTEKGIKFKTRYYKSDRAISEHWFEKARSRGSWKIDISYDPRILDRIYARLEDGRNYDVCYLIEGQGFIGKTAEELDYLEAYEKLNRQKNAGVIIQSKVDLISELENIVKKSKKKTEKNIFPEASKASRIRGIRENRANEKLVNRKKESFILGKEDKKPNSIDNVSIEEEDNTSTNIINIEYIRKMQEEGLKRKNE